MTAFAAASSPQTGRRASERADLDAVLVEHRFRHVSRGVLHKLAAELHIDPVRVRCWGLAGSPGASPLKNNPGVRWGLWSRFPCWTWGFSVFGRVLAVLIQLQIF